MQALEQADLPLGLGRVARACPHDFHGHGLASLRVAGPHDDAEGPGAELLDELEAALHHQRL